MFQDGSDEKAYLTPDRLSLKAETAAFSPRPGPARDATVTSLSTPRNETLAKRAPQPEPSPAKGKSSDRQRASSAARLVSNRRVALNDGVPYGTRRCRPSRLCARPRRLVAGKGAIRENCAPAEPRNFQVTVREGSAARKAWTATETESPGRPM